MAVGEEPRRLRADAARNRQSLIDAAQRLFAARGLSVTLDDIAAEAGVNVATAYRHFANKHELAAAYIQQQIATAIAIADEAAAAADLARAGKDAGEPAVVVRGLERFVTDDDGPGAAGILRPADEDLFG